MTRADATPFSRHQERPAWLILRVDGENMHRAPLEEIDSMWELYERACLQFPAKRVELVRLWGRPVAVAVIVDGRLALTRNGRLHGRDQGRLRAPAA